MLYYIFSILGFLAHQVLAHQNISPSSYYKSELQIVPLHDSSFIASWETYSQDQQWSTGVFACKLDSNFKRVGEEFQVNNYTESTQQAPAIAVLNSNDFVIVYESWDQDGDDYGVYAVHYSSDLQIVKSEFLVNVEVDGDQEHADVAALSDGGYVVVWQDEEIDEDGLGIAAQIYNSDSTVRVSSFLVNTFEEDSDQENPKVIGLEDGDFLVAWEGQNDDTDIFMQRFDSNGVAIGGQVTLNEYTTNDQEGVTFSVLEDDRLVVMWSTEDLDGDEYALYAQIFDLDLNPLTSQFQVNDDPNGTQESGHAILTSDGKLVFSWTTDKYDGEIVKAASKIYNPDMSVYQSQFLAAEAIGWNRHTAPRAFPRDENSLFYIWENGDYTIVDFSEVPDKYYIKNMESCDSPQGEGTLESPLTDMFAPFYKKYVKQTSIELIILANGPDPYFFAYPHNLEFGSLMLLEVPGFEGKFTIMPLFCDDQEVIDNPSFMDSCIGHDQKITLHMKTMHISFALQGINNVTIQNIIFNAQEDIGPHNHDEDIRAYYFTCENMTRVLCPDNTVQEKSEDGFFYCVRLDGTVDLERDDPFIQFLSVEYIEPYYIPEITTIYQQKHLILQDVDFVSLQWQKDPFIEISPPFNATIKNVNFINSAMSDNFIYSNDDDDYDLEVDYNILNIDNLYFNFRETGSFSYSWHFTLIKAYLNLETEINLSNVDITLNDLLTLEMFEITNDDYLLTSSLINLTISDFFLESQGLFHMDDARLYIENFVVSNINSDENVVLFEASEKLEARIQSISIYFTEISDQVEIFSPEESSPNVQIQSVLVLGCIFTDDTDESLVILSNATIEKIEIFETTFDDMWLTVGGDGLTRVEKFSYIGGLAQSIDGPLLYIEDLDYIEFGEIIVEEVEFDDTGFIDNEEELVIESLILRNGVLDDFDDYDYLIQNDGAMTIGYVEINGFTMEDLITDFAFFELDGTEFLVDYFVFKNCDFEVEDKSIEILQIQNSDMVINLPVIEFINNTFVYDDDVEPLIEISSSIGLQSLVLNDNYFSSTSDDTLQAFLFSNLGELSLEALECSGNTLEGDVQFLGIIDGSQITVPGTKMNSNRVQGGSILVIVDDDSALILEEPEISQNILTQSDLIQVSDSQILCTSGTISGNSLKIKSSLLKVEGQNAEATLQDITFLNTFLRQESVLFEIEELATLTLDQVLMSHFEFIISSIFLEITDKSNAFITNSELSEFEFGQQSQYIASDKSIVQFANNTVKYLINIDSMSKENQQTGDISLISLQQTSVLNIINCSFSETNNLIQSLASDVLVENTQFSHLMKGYSLRYLISISSGSISLTNITISDFEELEFEQKILEQLLTIQSTEIKAISNLSISSLNGDDGYLINVEDTELELQNINFTQTTISSGEPLISIRRGDLVSILNSTFTDISSLLSANGAEIINIENIEITLLSNNKYVILLESIVDANIETLSIQPSKGRGKCLAAIRINNPSGNIQLLNVDAHDLVTSYGAIMINEADSEEMMFQNISIQNIYSKEALVSAGLSILDFQSRGTINIHNCQFKELDAMNGKGGGFLLLPFHYSLQIKVNIANSTFINNRALTFGGALYTKNIIPKFEGTNNFNSNVIVSSEDIEYENHFGSTPYQVKVINIGEKYAVGKLPSENGEDRLLQESVLKGLKSGQVYKGDYVFALVDYYGNVVNDDSDAILSITIDNDDLSLSKTKIPCLNGICDISSLQFNFKMSETASISIKTNAIIPLVSQDSTIVDTSSTDFAIDLEFVECGMHEVAIGDTICKACPYGQALFSLTKNNEGPCQACDFDSMICYGDTQIGVQPGYWRKSEEADIFVKCPGGTTACAGSKVLENQDGSYGVSPLGECKKGYKGNACAQCEAGYGKSNDGTKCLDCTEDRGKIAIQIIGVIIFVSLLMILGTKSNLYIQQARKNEVAQEEAKSHQHNIRMGLLRILIDFMQIAGILIAIRIPWTDELLGVTRIYETLTISNSDVFSFECIYSLDSIIEMKTAFRSFLTTSLPVIVMLLVLLISTIYIKIAKPRRLTLKRITSAAIFIFMDLYFISIIKTNLSMFRCQNIYRTDNPLYYQLDDYEIECWDGVHIGYTFGFVVPITLLFAVALPIYFKHKVTKQQRESLSVIYLTAGTRQQQQSWFFYKFGMKMIMMILIIITEVISSRIQIFVMIYVLFMGYVVLKIKKPYASQVLTKMEESSFGILVLLNLFGIYFIGNRKEGLDKFITAVGIIAVIGFLIIWVIQYFSQIKKKIQNLFNQKEKSALYYILDSILFFENDKKRSS